MNRKRSLGNSETVPKTYKAAKEAGYFLDDRLLELTGLVPRSGEATLKIKAKVFYHRSQLEECISLTEGKKRGLKLREDFAPVGRRSFQPRGAGWISYDVYRLSDFDRSTTRSEVAAIEMPLLEAIWLVNKAAKTQRDLASTYYGAGMHGFAGNSRSRKEKYYGLKDRGIAFALSDGVLDWRGWHGNMSVVEGEGFRFHTRLRPKDAPERPNDSEFWMAEASSRRFSRKYRLKDAILTHANSTGRMSS